MCIGTNIYRVQYYLQFQTSAGGSQNLPPKDQGDYCNNHCNFNITITPTLRISLMQINMSCISKQSQQQQQPKIIWLLCITEAVLNAFQMLIYFSQQSFEAIIIIPILQNDLFACHWTNNTFIRLTDFFFKPCKFLLVCFLILAVVGLQCFLQLWGMWLLFIAVHRLLTVWLLLSWSRGFRCVQASVGAARGVSSYGAWGLSCSTACGIFLDQGLKNLNSFHLMI